jgi:hypothetical protein
MARVLLVFVIALGVGVLSYGAAYLRSGDQRLQESAEYLPALVANNPELDRNHAWYEEPINVALTGATITLAFGGFALMLERARLDQPAWQHPEYTDGSPGTPGASYTSTES